MLTSLPVALSELAQACHRQPAKKRKFVRHAWNEQNHTYWRRTTSMPVTWVGSTVCWGWRDIAVAGVQRSTTIITSRRATTTPIIVIIPSAISIAAVVIATIIIIGWTASPPSPTSSAPSSPREVTKLSRGTIFRTAPDISVRQSLKILDYLSYLGRGPGGRGTSGISQAYVISRAPSCKLAWRSLL